MKRFYASALLYSVVAFACLLGVQASFGMVTILKESATVFSGRLASEAEQNFATRLSTDMAIPSPQARTFARDVFEQLGFKADSDIFITSSVADQLGIMLRRNLSDITKEMFSEGLKEFDRLSGKLPENLKTTVGKVSSTRKLYMENATGGLRNFEGFSEIDKNAISALTEGTGVSAESVFKANLIEARPNFPNINPEEAIVSGSQNIVKEGQLGTKTQTQFEKATKVQTLLEEISKNFENLQEMQGLGLPQQKLTKQEQTIVDSLKRDPRLPKNVTLDLPLQQQKIVNKLEEELSVEEQKLFDTLLNQKTKVENNVVTAQKKTLAAPTEIDAKNLLGQEERLVQKQEVVQNTSVQIEREFFEDKITNNTKRVEGTPEEKQRFEKVQNEISTQQTEVDNLQKTVNDFAGKKKLTSVEQTKLEKNQFLLSSSRRELDNLLKEQRILTRKISPVKQMTQDINVLQELQGNGIKIGEAIDKGVVKGKSIRSKLDENTLLKDRFQTTVNKMKKDLETIKSQGEKLNYTKEDFKTAQEQYESIYQKDGILKPNETMEQGIKRYENGVKKLDAESQKLQQIQKEIDGEARYAKKNELYFKAVDNGYLPKPTTLDGKVEYTAKTIPTTAKTEIDGLSKDVQVVKEEVVSVQKTLQDANDSFFSSQLTDSPGLSWKKKSFGAVVGLAAVGVLVGGGVGLGYLISSMISEEEKKSGLLNAAQMVRKFGNIWMYIPPVFVDRKNPKNSLPLYVGAPYAAKKRPAYTTFAAQTLDAKQQYFADCTQEGELARFRVESPFFNGQLLQFTTGSLFDKQANLNKPMPQVPFIGSLLKNAEGATVAKSLNALSGRVRKPGPAIHKGSGDYTPKSKELFAYKGSPVVADLFQIKQNKTEFGPQGVYPQLAVQYQYPKLLNVTARALEQPHIVTNQQRKKVFSLKQVEALSSQEIAQNFNRDGQTVSTLLTGFQQKGDYPFAMLGTYVYQSSDTPFARKMRAEFGYLTFVDYLMCLDKDGKIVPLYIPQQSGEYNFFRFTYNSNIAFIKSMLNGVVYDGKNGVVISQPSVTIAQAQFIPSNKVWDISLQKQIASIKAVVTELLVKGPFIIGGTALYPNTSWEQQQIHIYEHKNGLVGNVNDYLIALRTEIDEFGKQKKQIAQLPEERAYIDDFFSLVTSRMYDKNLKPYKAPEYKQVQYAVSDQGRVFFADTQRNLNAQTVGQTIKLSGATDQYSIYMDPDVNPIDFSSLGGSIMQERQRLVYKKIMPFYAGAEFPNMSVLPQAVQTKIDVAWKNWKQAYEKTWDSKKRQSKISLEQGPFTFYDPGRTDTASIFITATSEADVQAGLNVYTSAAYPQQYLVAVDSIGTKAADLKFTFGSFSNQRYLVSANRGYVYDAQEQGKPIGLLKPQQIWTELKKFYGTRQMNIANISPALAAQIEVYIYHSQQVARESEQYVWDTFSLYLNQHDQVKGQHVYGNSTGIPTKTFMQATTQELEENLMSDWFVCGEYIRDAQGKEQKDAQGNYRYTFGTPYDVATTKVLVSLTTFQLYNSNGEPIGWYGDTEKPATLQSNMNERLTKASTKLEDYKTVYTELLGPLAKKASVNAYNNLRIYKQIEVLARKALAQLKTEQDSLIKLKQEIAAQTPPLDVNIAQLLKAPVIEPQQGMVPRYLRKAQNDKYYQILPDKPKDTDVIYITTYNATKEKTDSKMGYVYEINPGTPTARTVVPGRGFALAGNTLELVRLQAGVKVAANGAQTLTIGLEHPNIQVDKLLPLAAKEVAAYTTKLKTAQTKMKTLHDLATKQGKTLTAEQEKQYDQANADIALYEQALASSKAIDEAQQAKLITMKLSDYKANYAHATAQIDGFYLHSATGTYFIKMSDGADSWYVSFDTGDLFDISTGQPRVRPAYTVEKNKLYQQVLVNTKNANNIALLTTDGLKLKQLEYQTPQLAGATTFASYPQTAQRSVQTATQPYIEYRMFTAGPLTHTVLLKEAPVDKDFNPTAQTLYTIREKMPGYLNFVEVGTYKPNSQLFFGQLTYVNSRVGGKDKGVVDADRAKLGPVLFVWNGDEARLFKQVHYQHQLIQLMAQGSTYTGTIYGTKLQDDENGITREIIDKTKSRTITVKKVMKPITGGITESMITIVDGNTEYDFHYQTAVLADMRGLIKNIVQLAPITDAYGITRLAYRIPSTFKGVAIQAGDIQNIPADKKAEVAARIAKAKLFTTRNGKHIVYNLQKDDPLGEKLPGWDVDLQSGVLYDVFGVPQASLNLVQLQQILDNLQVAVQVNGEGKPQLVYQP